MRAVLQSYGRILAMASSDSPSGGDRDVFSGLPNARPQRRSAKRDRGGKGAASAQDGGGARRAPKKAPPQARAAASTRPMPGGRKPRAKAAAAQPKAAPVPPAGYATPADDDPPRGTDLVGTAVQAAGELAQIGIAAGGRALKSAIQRLPRP
jgi:hypothetical protein